MDKQSVTGVSTLKPEEIKVRIEAFSLNHPESATNKAKGILGTVVQAGDAASGLLNKRVLVPSCRPCGECNPCRKGVVSFCSQATPRSEDDDPHSVSQARFAVPLENSFSEAGHEAAACGGFVGEIYGMFCAGGFKIGSQCIVAGGTASFKMACHATGEALGVKTTFLSTPFEKTNYNPPESFDDSPKLVLVERRHLSDLDKLATIAPHGSTMVIRHDESDHPIDFAPWISAGNHIVSHHKSHPELIPELLSLNTKGFLDLSKMVSLESSTHENTDVPPDSSSQLLKVVVV